MTATGWQPAGLGANSARTGTVAWSNPTRVDTSDNSFATAALTGGSNNTQWLDTTTYGYDGSGAAEVPATDTIDGMEARFDRRSAAGGGTVKDLNVQILIAGAESGENKADTTTLWPNTEAQAAYPSGGSTSDLWSLTPTAAQIRATNFGFGVRGQHAGGGGRSCAVDFSEMQIHHSAGAPAGVEILRRRIEGY